MHLWSHLVKIWLALRLHRNVSFWISLQMAPLSRALSFVLLWLEKVALEYWELLHSEIGSHLLVLFIKKRFKDYTLLKSIVLLTMKGKVLGILLVCSGWQRFNTANGWLSLWFTTSTELYLSSRHIRMVIGLEMILKRYKKASWTRGPCFLALLKNYNNSSSTVVTWS